MTTVTAVGTYIVEHPTKGVLMDQEFEYFDDDWQAVWTSRFAWSKHRSEAWKHLTIESARNAIEKMTGKDRERCQILTFGNWEVVR